MHQNLYLLHLNVLLKFLCTKFVPNSQRASIVNAPASGPTPASGPPQATAPVPASVSASGSAPAPVFVDEEISELSYKDLPFLNKLIELKILEKYSLIMSGWSRYDKSREFEPRLGLVILVKNEIIDKSETPYDSQNMKISRKHVPVNLNEENEKHYLVLSIGIKKFITKLSTKTFYRFNRFGKI